MRLIGSATGGIVTKPPTTNEKNRPAKSSPRKSQSLPVRSTAPSFLQSRKSDTGTVNKAPVPVKKSVDNELAKVFIGAKPSEIRAAAKAGRIERERQNRLLQNQQHAQLKMNKIRAEIDAIKAKEEAERQQLEAISLERKEPPAKMQVDTEETPNLDGSMESILASMESEENGGLDVEEKGRKVMEEMNASFARFSGAEDLSSDETAEHREFPKATSTDTAACENQVHRRVPSAHRHARKPSNLVPEMRRRASKHDLLFDDELHVPAGVLGTMTTHSPVTGEAVAAEATVCARTDMKAKSEHIPSSNKGVAKVASTTVYDAPSTPTNANKQSVVSEISPTQIRANVTISPKRDKKTLAKMEEEKMRIDEQKKQLESAKNYFQEGHDLCWKMQDSVGALGGYRKALFIRESLLGKYHEETGRTYYWIGRSLVKLKEYDEALVAFSRAYRIFDRVLSKNHKYRNWAETAIAGCFKDMDDSGRFCEDYQRNLDDSIAHERAGDAHRKQRQFDDAISEYRAAIASIEEYHPDAADLHCKIAMVLRRQGEFDKSVEENRSALEIYELSLGAEHPETVKTLNQTLEKKRMNQVSLALMEKLKFGK